MTVTRFGGSRRRLRREAGSLCAASLLAATLGLGACAPAPVEDDRRPASAAAHGIPAEAFPITVESVHDGDTLRARVDDPNDVIADTESTRIRLLGIDTPEISPDAECGAAEAREALTALAPPGALIWAAPDREVLDRYGRHLLYLWTPDGRLINAELVAAGHARVTVYAPNDRHEDLLRMHEEHAAETGAGLWSACR